MKKKNIKILVFASFFILFMGAAVYLGLTSSRKPGHFQRLSFLPDEKSEVLAFNKSSHRWVDGSGGEIPRFSSTVNGTGIRFSEGGVLKLKPGVSGPKGLYFCLDALRSPNSEFSLTFRIIRKKGILLSREISSRKKRTIRFVYSKSREFSREDELIIEASGKGALVVSQAFVYDLIENPKRKFVFVIGLDTKRWDKIGQVVNGVALTPHLNRFRQDSVTFENAIAQGCWTLPSFTSFFTGLYEFNHRIERNHVLDAGIPFLIEDFARSFMTASINGGGWLSGKIGNSRGFDFYKFGSRAKDVFASRELFKHAERFILENPVPTLFLFMHTYAIHAPYEPPEEFLLRLNKRPLFRKHGTYTLKNQFRNGISPAVRRAMVELYDAEVMTFDYFFGRFIDFLKKIGIYDQSMIVFFSDHGEEFYEHQGWSHGHALYNELIRVPLLIKFPANQFRMTRIENNVGVIDILPTLLDYLRIDQKKKVDGISLMDIIERKNRNSKGTGSDIDSHIGKKPRFLVSSLTTCPFFKPIPRKVAIFFDRYKLIYNFPVGDKDKSFFRKSGMPPGVPRFQVFDMKTDPLEKRNLYPMRGDLMVLFRRELDKIIEKVRRVLAQEKSDKVDFDKTDLKDLKTLGYL